MRQNGNARNVTIIGIDLAKRVFHAHGARADGSVAFRKRLTPMLTKNEDYRNPVVAI
jgi:transposase